MKKGRPLLAKKSMQSGKAAALAVLPFFYGLLDVLENVGIDLSILAYPRRMSVFAALSGYLTLFKSIFLTAAQIAAFFLAVMVVARKLSRGRYSRQHCV